MRPTSADATRRCCPCTGFTAQRAELKPPTLEFQRLVARLAGNQADIDQFAGITAGTTSIAEFFAPDNIDRIAGQRVQAA